jgi:acyl-CoA thioesterase-1
VKRALALFNVLVLAAACSRKPAPAAKAAPERKPGPVALFVGDSLTAGYGVDAEDAWPTLVGAEWARRGLGWRARNAAISGATSAGIRQEVDWALTPDVKLVFVCIGGNDGLRGVPPNETRRNVDELIQYLQTRGVRVALAGMRIPPNYGEGRAKEFAAIFPAIAKRRGVPFMAFLLDGVAGDPALNQEDGIHPNAAGHKRVAAAVLAFLDEEKLVR